MSWHLEHHMFAGVPCYNLKKLHKAVADDMPKVRTFFGAWKEMLEIKRRQQLDPNYEFDTPVPNPNKTRVGKKWLVQNLSESSLLLASDRYGIA